MGRRKQAGLDVPATTGEATALIADYVAAERKMARLAHDCGEAIDAMKAERDLIFSEIEAEQKPRFAALKSWWEAGGKQIAADRRSAELAGARLGIRLTPPRVKLARGFKDGPIITWLKIQPWKRAATFLRAKVELDKPAIIKAVQAETELRGLFEKQGLTVVQVDEFFIDSGVPAPAPATEATAEIPVPAGG